MSSSSEDIKIIDPPPSLSSSKPRSSPAFQHNAEAGPSRPRAVVQLSSDDDDEPVFVGATKAAQLTEKFAYQSAAPPRSARSRSRSNTSESKSKAIAKSKTNSRKALKKEEEGSDDKKRLNVGDVLVPLPTVHPTPPPLWLGQPKILLRLSDCPVCKKRLTKSQSGPARWVGLPVVHSNHGRGKAYDQRHISTCLPPLYRPPNPPPDLQSLIGIALEEVNNKNGPVSLIEYHVNTLGETSEEGVAGIIGYLDANSKPRPRVSVKPKSAPTSLNITTVRSPQDRGHEWPNEIEERMEEFLGVPSSPAKSENMPLSPVSTGLPSTQPMGESSLTTRYSRDRVFSEPLSHHSDLPSSPGQEVDTDLSDEENIPPMPPSSQKARSRRHSSSPEVLSPFRRRGGLRVGGSLPGIYESAYKEHCSGKRIRVGEGSA